MVKARKHGEEPLLHHALAAHLHHPQPQDRHHRCQVYICMYNCDVPFGLIFCLSTMCLLICSCEMCCANKGMRRGATMRTSRGRSTSPATPSPRGSPTSSDPCGARTPSSSTAPSARFVSDSSDAFVSRLLLNWDSRVFLSIICCLCSKFAI